MFFLKQNLVLHQKKKFINISAEFSIILLTIYFSARLLCPSHCTVSNTNVALILVSAVLLYLSGQPSIWMVPLFMKQLLPFSLLRWTAPAWILDKSSQSGKFVSRHFFFFYVYVVCFDKNGITVKKEKRNIKSTNWFEIKTLTHIFCLPLLRERKKSSLYQI